MSKRQKIIISSVNAILQRTVDINFLKNKIEKFLTYDYVS